MYMISFLKGETLQLFFVSFLLWDDHGIHTVPGYSVHPDSICYILMAYSNYYTRRKHSICNKKFSQFSWFSLNCKCFPTSYGHVDQQYNSTSILRWKFSYKYPFCKLMQKFYPWKVLPCIGEWRLTDILLKLHIVFDYGFWNLIMGWLLMVATINVMSLYGKIQNMCITFDAHMHIYTCT